MAVIIDVGFKEDSSVQDVINHLTTVKTTMEEIGKTPDSAASFLETMGLSDQGRLELITTLSETINSLNTIGPNLDKIPTHLQQSFSVLKTEITGVEELLNDIDEKQASYTKSSLKSMRAVQQVMMSTASINAQSKNIEQYNKALQNVSDTDIGWTRHEHLRYAEAVMPFLDSSARTILASRKHGLTSEGLINEVAHDASNIRYIMNLGKQTGHEIQKEQAAENIKMYMRGFSEYLHGTAAGETLRDWKLQGVYSTKKRAVRVEDRFENDPNDYRKLMFAGFGHNARVEKEAAKYISEGHEKRIYNGRKGSELRALRDFLAEDNNMDEVFPLLKELGIATINRNGKYAIYSHLKEQQLQALSARATQEYQKALRSDAPYENDPTQFINAGQMTHRQGAKPTLWLGLNNALPANIIPSLAGYEELKKNGPVKGTGGTISTGISVGGTPSLNRYYIPQTEIAFGAGKAIVKDVNWRKDLSKGIDVRPDDEYVAITDSLIARMFNMQGNRSLGAGHNEKNGAIIRYDDQGNPISPNLFVSDFSRFITTDEKTGDYIVDKTHPDYQKAEDILSRKSTVKYGNDEYRALYTKDDGRVVFGKQSIIDAINARYEQAHLPSIFNFGNDRKNGIFFEADNQKTIKQVNALAKMASSGTAIEDLMSEQQAEKLQNAVGIYANFEMLYDILDGMEKSGDSPYTGKWNKIMGRRMDGLAFGDPTIFSRDFQGRFAGGTDKFAMGAYDWRPMLLQGWEKGHKLNERIYGYDTDVTGMTEKEKVAHRAVFVPTGGANKEDRPFIEAYISGKHVNGKDLTPEEIIDYNRRFFTNAAARVATREGVTKDVGYIIDRSSNKSGMGFRSMDVGHFFDTTTGEGFFTQKDYEEAIKDNRITSEGQVILLPWQQEQYRRVHSSLAMPGKSGFVEMKNENDMMSEKNFIPESVLRAVNAPAEIFEASERLYQQKLAELNTTSGRIKQFKNDPNAMEAIDENPDWVWTNKEAITHIEETRRALEKNRSLHKVMLDGEKERREGAVGVGTVGQLAEILNAITGMDEESYGQFKSLLPSVMERNNAVFSTGISAEKIDMAGRFPWASDAYIMDINNWGQAAEVSDYFNALDEIKSKSIQRHRLRQAEKKNPGVSAARLEKLSNLDSEISDLSKKLNTYQSEMKADPESHQALRAGIALKRSGRDPRDINSMIMTASQIYAMNTGDFDGDTVNAFIGLSDAFKENARLELETVHAQVVKNKEAQLRAPEPEEERTTPFANLGEANFTALAQAKTATQKMAVASAALRKAQTADMNEADRVAAIAEAMEAYDQATSDVKTKGAKFNLGKFAEKYLYSQGAHYDRFLKSIHQAGDDNENDIYNQGSIFKFSPVSTTDPIGLVALSMRHSNASTVKDDDGKFHNGIFDLDSYEKFESWYRQVYGADRGYSARAARFMLNRMEENVIWGKLSSIDQIKGGRDIAHDWRSKLDAQRQSGYNVDDEMKQLEDFEKRLDEMEGPNAATIENVAKLANSYEKKAKTETDLVKRKGYEQYIKQLRRMLPENEDEVTRNAREAFIETETEKRKAHNKQVHDLSNASQDAQALDNALQESRINAIISAARGESKHSIYNWSNLKHFIGADTKIDAALTMPTLRRIKLNNALDENGAIRRDASGKIVGEDVTRSVNYFKSQNDLNQHMLDMIYTESGEIEKTKVYQNPMTHIGQLMHSVFEYGKAPEEVAVYKSAEQAEKHYIDSFRAALLGKGTWDTTGHDAAALKSLGLIFKEDSYGNLVAKNAPGTHKYGEAELGNYSDIVNNLFGRSNPDGTKEAGFLQQQFDLLRAYEKEGEEVLAVEDKLYRKGQQVNNERKDPFGGNIYRQVVTDKEGNIIHTETSLDKDFKYVANEDNGETSHVFSTHAKVDRASLMTPDAEGVRGIHVYDWKSGDTGAVESIPQSVYYGMLFSELAKKYYDTGDVRYEQFKEWGHYDKNKNWQSNVRLVTGVNAREGGENYNFDATTKEGQEEIERWFQKYDKALLTEEALGLEGFRGVHSLLARAGDAREQFKDDVKSARELAYDTNFKPTDAETQFFLSTYAQNKERLTQLQSDIYKENNKNSGRDYVPTDRFSRREDELQNMFSQEMLAAVLLHHDDKEAIKKEVDDIQDRRAKLLGLNEASANTAAVKDIEEAQVRIHQSLAGVKPTSEANLALSAMQQMKQASRTREFLTSNEKYFKDGKFRTAENGETNAEIASIAKAREDAYMRSLGAQEEAEKFLDKELNTYFDKYDKSQSLKIKDLTRIKPADPSEAFSRYVEKKQEELEKEIEQYNENVRSYEEEMNKEGTSAERKRQLKRFRDRDQASAKELQEYLDSGKMSERIANERAKELGLTKETNGEKVQNWLNERLAVVAAKKRAKDDAFSAMMNADLDPQSTLQEREALRKKYESISEGPSSEQLQAQATSMLERMNRQDRNAYDDFVRGITGQQMTPEEKAIRARQTAEDKIREQRDQFDANSEMYRLWNSRLQDRNFIDKYANMELLNAQQADATSRYKTMADAQAQLDRLNLIYPSRNQIREQDIKNLEQQEDDIRAKLTPDVRRARREEEIQKRQDDSNAMLAQEEAAAAQRQQQRQARISAEQARVAAEERAQITSEEEYATAHDEWERKKADADKTYRNSRRRLNRSHKKTLNSLAREQETLTENYNKDLQALPTEESINKQYADIASANQRREEQRKAEIDRARAEAGLGEKQSKIDELNKQISQLPTGTERDRLIAEEAQLTKDINKFRQEKPAMLEQIEKEKREAYANAPFKIMSQNAEWMKLYEQRKELPYGSINRKNEINKRMDALEQSSPELAAENDRIDKEYKQKLGAIHNTEQSLLDRRNALSYAIDQSREESTTRDKLQAELASAQNAYDTSKNELDRREQEINKRYGLPSTDADIEAQRRAALDKVESDRQALNDNYQKETARIKEEIDKENVNYRNQGSILSVAKAARIGAEPQLNVDNQQIQSNAQSVVDQTTNAIANAIQSTAPTGVNANGQPVANAAQYAVEQAQQYTVEAAGATPPQDQQAPKSYADLYPDRIKRDAAYKADMERVQLDENIRKIESYKDQGLSDAEQRMYEDMLFRRQQMDADKGAATREYYENTMRAELDLRQTQGNLRVQAINDQSMLAAQQREHQYRQQNRNLWGASRSRILNEYRKQSDMGFALDQQIKNDTLARDRLREETDAKDKAFEAKYGVSAKNYKGSDLAAVQEANGINAANAQIQAYNQKIADATAQSQKFSTAGNVVRATFSGISGSVNMLMQRFGRQMFYKALNEAKRFVKEFDRSMTNIQMITLKTDGQMASLGDGLIAKAKQLKTSISDITKTAETLYRQGLSDKEVNDRLEVITKFSRVSGTKTDAATKLITIAMNTGLVTDAYQAADVVTALGDNAATNAAEIEKGIEKAGAAAAADGTTFEELASMLTAITSTTQIGGNVAGRTLNTIIGRMNKIGTNELIIDENGNQVSGSAVSTLLKAQGINTYDAGGNKRSTFDVLYDLSQKWEDMTDATQQQIATAIAGTRQYSNFAAIMQGMKEGKVDEYMKLASDSEGIVKEKDAIYMESLQASLDSFKTIFDSVIHDLVDSGALKGIVEDLGAMLVGLGKIVGALGKIKLLGPSLLAIFGAMKGAMIGGAWGALAGGVLGLVGGFALKGLGESDQPKKTAIEKYQERDERIKNTYIDYSKQIARANELKNLGSKRTEEEEREFKSLITEFALRTNYTNVEESADGASKSIDNLSGSLRYLDTISKKSAKEMDQYGEEYIKNMEIYQNQQRMNAIVDFFGGLNYEIEDAYKQTRSERTKLNIFDYDENGNRIISYGYKSLFELGDDDFVAPIVNFDEDWKNETKSTDSNVDLFDPSTWGRAVEQVVSAVGSAFNDTAYIEPGKFAGALSQLTHDRAQYEAFTEELATFADTSEVKYAYKNYKSNFKGELDDIEDPGDFVRALLKTIDEEGMSGGQHNYSDSEMHFLMLLFEDYYKRKLMASLQTQETPESTMAYTLEQRLSGLTPYLTEEQAKDITPISLYLAKKIGANTSNENIQQVLKDELGIDVTNPTEFSNLNFDAFNEQWSGLAKKAAVYAGADYSEIEDNFKKGDYYYNRVTGDKISREKALAISKEDEGYVEVTDAEGNLIRTIYNKDTGSRAASLAEANRQLFGYIDENGNARYTDDKGNYFFSKEQADAYEDAHVVRTFSFTGRQGELIEQTGTKNELLGYTDESGTYHEGTLSQARKDELAKPIEVREERTGAVLARTTDMDEAKQLQQKYAQIAAESTPARRVKEEEKADAANMRALKKAKGSEVAKFIDYDHKTHYFYGIKNGKDAYAQAQEALAEYEKDNQYRVVEAGGYEVYPGEYVLSQTSEGKDMAYAPEIGRAATYAEAKEIAKANQRYWQKYGGRWTSLSEYKYNELKEQEKPYYWVGYKNKYGYRKIDAEDKAIYDDIIKNGAYFGSEGMLTTEEYKDYRNQIAEEQGLLEILDANRYAIIGNGKYKGYNTKEQAELNMPYYVDGQLVGYGEEGKKAQDEIKAAYESGVFDEYWYDPFEDASAFNMGVGAEGQKAVAEYKADLENIWDSEELQKIYLQQLRENDANGYFDQKALTKGVYINDDGSSYNFYEYDDKNGARVRVNMATGMATTMSEGIQSVDIDENGRLKDIVSALPITKEEWVNDELSFIQPRRPEKTFTQGEIVPIFEGYNIDNALNAPEFDLYSKFNGSVNNPLTQFDNMLRNRWKYIAPNQLESGIGETDLGLTVTTPEIQKLPKIQIQYTKAEVPKAVEPANILADVISIAGQIVSDIENTYEAFEAFGAVVKLVEQDVENVTSDKVRLIKNHFMNGVSTGESTWQQKNQTAVAIDNAVRTLQMAESIEIPGVTQGASENLTELQRMQQLFDFVNFTDNAQWSLIAQNDEEFAHLLNQIETDDNGNITYIPEGTYEEIVKYLYKNSSYGQKYQTKQERAQSTVEAIKGLTTGSNAIDYLTFDNETGDFAFHGGMLGGTSFRTLRNENEAEQLYQMYKKASDKTITEYVASEEEKGVSSRLLQKRAEAMRNDQLSRSEWLEKYGLTYLQNSQIEDLESIVGKDLANRLSSDQASPEEIAYALNLAENSAYGIEGLTDYQRYSQLTAIRNSIASGEYKTLNDTVLEGLTGDWADMKTYLQILNAQQSEEGITDKRILELTGNRTLDELVEDIDKEYAKRNAQFKYAGDKNAETIANGAMALISGTEAEKLQVAQTALSGLRDAKNAQYYINRGDYGREGRAAIAGFTGLDEKTIASMSQSEEGRAEIQKLVTEKRSEIIDVLAKQLDIDLNKSTDIKADMRAKAAEVGEGMSMLVDQALEGVDELRVEAGNVIANTVQGAKDALSAGTAYEDALSGVREETNTYKGFKLFGENAQDIIDTVPHLQEGRTVSDALTDYARSHAAEGFDAEKFFADNPIFAAMFSMRANDKISDDVFNRYLSSAMYGTEKTNAYYSGFTNAAFGGLFVNEQFNPEDIQSVASRYDELLADDTMAQGAEELTQKYGSLADAIALFKSGDVIGAKKALRQFNEELAGDKVSDATKYSKGAQNLASALTKVKKGGKDAAEGMFLLRKNVKSYQDSITAVNKAQGKSGKGLDTRTREIIAGMFEDITPEEIKEMSKEELAELLKDVPDAVNTAYSEDLQSVINSGMGDQQITVDLSQVSVDANGEVNLADLTASCTNISEEVLAQLKAMEGEYGTVTFQVDANGNVVAVKGVVDANKTGKYNNKSSGGGGGKSKIDELLEKQKRKAMDIEHQNKLLEIKEKEYDYQNDYGGMNETIDAQISNQEKLRAIYAENIAELKEMQKTVKADSDDWWKLQEAINSAEESLAGINSTINELNAKRISILDQQQQNQDKPVTHMQNMLDKLAQRATSEDRFADYVSLTQQRIEQINAQKTLNDAQLKEWEAQLRNYEEGSDSWIEVRDKIWAIEEENAELENQAIQQTLDLNEQRLAQIAKVLQYDTATATHNQNIASTYGGYYQTGGFRKQYEDMLRVQLETNAELIEANKAAEISVLEQMKTLEEGSSAWYSAQAAVYQYQEAIAQAEVSQQELNRTLAESNLEDITDRYTDATREVIHVNELLTSQAEYYQSTRDFEAYTEAMSRYIGNISIQLAAERQALAELQGQYDQGMATETLDPTMQRQYLDQINEREKAVQSLIIEQENRQRELDRSNLDRLLDEQNKAQSAYDHNMKLVQFQATRYQNAGELTNYGHAIEMENIIREQHVDTLKDEIAALEERQQYYRDKYGEGTEDEIRIVDTIKQYEEALRSENVEIEKNNKLLEENRQKIRQVQKTLEDAVDKEIEDEKRRQREILSANVSMQDTVLELLRKRLQEEWTLKKRDIDKEKESLNEYKRLINERYNYRKKAAQEADKTEEISAYRRQLALIEADVTRTKEAKELRRKIEEMEKEQAWTIAEDELNAENERIDQQIEGMDNYVQYNEEKLNEILSDANNFTTELNDILTGSYEESYDKIIAFMQTENEAFMKSLPDAQTQMIQGWEDTWKKANDIVDSNYAMITEILYDKDTYMDYMKNTNRTYRSYLENGDENSMRILEKTWSDYYDDYINSRRDNAEFELHDHTVGDVISKIDELKDNIFQVNIVDIIGNPISPYGLDGSRYQYTDNSYGAGYTLNDYTGIGYVAPPAEAPAASSTPSGSGKATTAKKKYGYDFTDQFGVQHKSEKIYDTEQEAIDAGTEVMRSIIRMMPVSLIGQPNATNNQFSVKAYKHGGLADYTGLAWVDGTKSNPESFLDATDTKLMRAMLDTFSYVSSPYMSYIDPSMYGTNTTVGDVNITINQAELKSDADIKKLAKQVGKEFTNELKVNGISVAGYAFA